MKPSPMHPHIDLTTPFFMPPALSRHSPPVMLSSPSLFPCQSQTYTILHTLKVKVLPSALPVSNAWHTEKSNNISLGLNKWISLKRTGYCIWGNKDEGKDVAPTKTFVVKENHRRDLVWSEVLLGMLKSLYCEETVRQRHLGLMRQIREDPGRFGFSLKKKKKLTSHFSLLGHSWTYCPAKATKKWSAFPRYGPAIAPFPYF